MNTLHGGSLIKLQSLETDVCGGEEVEEPLKVLGRSYAFAEGCADDEGGAAVLMLGQASPQPRGASSPPTDRLCSRLRSAGS